MRASYSGYYATLPKLRRRFDSARPLPNQKSPENFGRFLLGYFTASLRAFPGLNLGKLPAGILIFSPVLGFLPSLAAL